MKTHTVLVTPEEDPVVVCNTWERRHWQVRQIVLNPVSMHTYVVFERRDDASTDVMVDRIPVPKNLKAKRKMETPHYA